MYFENGLAKATTYWITGGERGIQTPEARFRRLHTFQACSFNHSDTSPKFLPSCYLDKGGGILAPLSILHKFNYAIYGVPASEHGTMANHMKMIA